MDTTALAARIPLTCSHAGTGTAACGLAFDHSGGPLVAICGLVGGAGTTTLALSLARQAASESSAPVLVTEADAHRAGLAALAGAGTPESLAGLARRLAAGETPERSFAELAPGLRLIAAPPTRPAPATPDELCALLDQARAAHGLVIIDCGSDWIATAPIFQRATHILWALPATLNALARARMLLAADVLPRPGHARETLAAVASRPRPDISVRALRALAAERCERLVLIPHSERITRGDPAGDERLRRALSGLATTLRRAT